MVEEDKTDDKGLDDSLRKKRKFPNQERKIDLKNQAPDSTRTISDTEEIRKKNMLLRIRIFGLRQKRVV